MNPYDVTITDGEVTKKYLVDRASDDYKYQSIPTLRPQQDTGSNPSEQSINPEIGWLRSIESFHHGAGQKYADRTESDRYRYRASKGVNPWTKWELTLLNETQQIRTTSDIVNSVLGVGLLYYGTHNGEVYTATSRGGAWSGPAAAGTGYIYLTTDGTTKVYAGSSTGISSATIGFSSFSSYATGTSVLALDFIKGRLMAAGGSTGSAIYNITTSGAFPTALGDFSHVVWNSFAEGRNRIYVAGNTLFNSQGVIYKIGIKSDGTGLDPPVPAMPGMPFGERISAIGNYLGYIFVTTSVGVRMCAPDDDGDLRVGPPIEIPGGATGKPFGDGRFVYFGWPDFDASSAGLGRLDLQSFTDELLPAYASDMMLASTTATTVGPITRFQGELVWAVNSLGSDNGVWTKDLTEDKVSSGYVESGYITYNISDPKTPQAVDTRHRPLPAGSSIVTSLNVDDAGYVAVSTLDSDSDDTRVALTGYGHSERVELKATLNRATAVTAGPTLERLTLLSEVIVQSGMYIYLPVMLSDADALHGGYTKSRNIGEELEQLITWRTERTSLTLSIGTQTYSVVLRDFRTSNHHKGRTDDEQGTVLLQFKESA